jgi:hypothetical protein
MLSTLWQNADLSWVIGPHTVIYANAVSSEWMINALSPELQNYREHVTGHPHTQMLETEEVASLFRVMKRRDPGWNDPTTFRGLAGESDNMRRGMQFVSFNSMDGTLCHLLRTMRKAAFPNEAAAAQTIDEDGNDVGMEFNETMLLPTQICITNADYSGSNGWHWFLMTFDVKLKVE